LRDGPTQLPLRGLLLNYGVFDSRLDTPSYAEFATDYGLTRERMEFYWRAYAPRAVDRASPLTAPLRGELASLPPCLLHIAELDVLASENHAMAARLQAAGVPMETRVFPGTVHGFLRAVGHVGQARAAVTMAGDWLKARFA
jgi:acetyl esterase